MKTTAIFIVLWTSIFLLGLLGWTLWHVATGNQEATVSKTMEYAARWPIIPAGLGLILGLVVGGLLVHWFDVDMQRVLEDREMQKKSELDAEQFPERH